MALFELSQMSRLYAHCPPIPAQTKEKKHGWEFWTCH